MFNKENQGHKRTLFSLHNNIKSIETKNIETNISLSTEPVEDDADMKELLAWAE